MTQQGLDIRDQNIGREGGIGIVRRTGPMAAKI